MVLLISGKVSKAFLINDCQFFSCNVIFFEIFYYLYAKVLDSLNF